jgi:hypothetical protein
MATPESQQLLLRAEAERADRAEERASLAEVRASLAEERASLAEVARAAAEAAAQAALARVVFRIQVLEHQDNYTGKTVPGSEPELAVAAFLSLCRRYVSPREVAQKDASFSACAVSVTYQDCSGGDKPKLITMTGPITEAMLAALEEGIKDLYLNVCECGAKYPLGRWALCRPCLERAYQESGHEIPE